MVDRQLRARGIADPRVLEAMRRVPRHRFVPAAWRSEAYADYPLPIGEGQTISQPYIVALMTEALALTGGEKVLEIGTGSGYQTALLAELGARVWTIERSSALSRLARERLSQAGTERVRCIAGDGTLGLASEAPFDRILATGSLPEVPPFVFRQLRDGGVFVGPIGSRLEQQLMRMVYHPAAPVWEDLGGCRFVPLIGDGGWSGAFPP
jgi:protein-L-isoaspartate(D-aspartate) O-methyltransferase